MRFILVSLAVLLTTSHVSSTDALPHEFRNNWSRDIYQAAKTGNLVKVTQLIAVADQFNMYIASRASAYSTVLQTAAKAGLVDMIICVTNSAWEHGINLVGRNSIYFDELISLSAWHNKNNVVEYLLATAASVGLDFQALKVDIRKAIEYAAMWQNVELTRILYSSAIAGGLTYFDLEDGIKAAMQQARSKNSPDVQAYLESLKPTL